MNDDILFQEQSNAVDVGSEKTTSLLEEEPINSLFATQENNSIDEILFTVDNVEPPTTEPQIEMEMRISSNPNEDGNGLMSSQLEGLMQERDRLAIELGDYKEKVASYERSHESLTKQLDLLRDSEQVIKSRLAEKDSTIAEHVKFREEATIHLSKLQEIAQTNKQAYLNVSDKLKEMEESSDDVEQLTSQLVTLNTELQQAKVQLTEYEVLSADLEQTLNEFKQKLHDSETSFNSLTEEHNQLKLTADELIAEIEQLKVNPVVSVEQEQIINSLKEELQSTQLKLAEALVKGEEKSVSTLISHSKLQHIEETIKNNRERYNDLEQNFKEQAEESKNRESELLASIELMRCEVESLQIGISSEKVEKEGLNIELKSAKLELTNSNSINSELNNKLVDTETTIRSLTEQLSVTNAELTTVKDEKESLVTKLDNILSSPFFAKYAINIDNLMQRISELPLEVDNKELLEAQSKLNSLNDNIKSKDITIERLNDSKQKLQKELETSLEESVVLTNESQFLKGTLKTLETEKNSLTEQLNDVQKELELVKVQLLEQPNSSAVQPLEVEELTNVKERVNELEITAENLREGIKKRDERISKYKENELDFRDTISKLKKENNAVTGDLQTASVETFTQELFGMTPEQLYNKFNEYAVTLEIANFNLDVMNSFPKAKEMLTKKVEDNKPKLASILTKKYPYAK